VGPPPGDGGQRFRVWIGDVEPRPGALIGVGQGRGIGFIFIIMGLFTVAQIGAASMCRRLVMIESECPDVVADQFSGTTRRAL
jgi:hypothetical protein